jgi:hypothetical protein
MAKSGLLASKTCIPFHDPLQGRASLSLRIQIHGKYNHNWQKFKQGQEQESYRKPSFNPKSGVFYNQLKVYLKILVCIYLGVYLMLINV